MKSVKSILVAAGLLMLNGQVSAQQASGEVVITGVRFAYPLVEKWISDYKNVNPQANIRIESRTVTDPQKYDLLIEAYEQGKAAEESREFVSLGRYALLPVANAKSEFAKEYAEKGLTEKTYKQVFFHDIYAEKDKSLPANYTIYTRLQKAGAPVTFAKYFGYEQQNIKGKSIAGADEHLIKALLKDETGVSYTTIGLAYDQQTGKPVEGLTIIPVDLDGNGKVTKDEKVLDSRELLIAAIENQKVKNVPIEYIHFSIDKSNTNAEARKFLLWVAENAEKDLHQFGYLKGENGRLLHEKEKLESLLRK
jgi:ABC-type phosphate transport system substrate-binding protein